MKVQIDYEEQKELKARKMSPAIISFVMVVMLIVGAGVYVSVKPSPPKTIDAARAEKFQQISRQFHSNANGLEVPMKFVSGTEKVKGKTFYASIFIKFPLDLIDNKVFVGRIMDLIIYEIEDAFDFSSNGNKTVTAELAHPQRKAFEDIIEAIFLVDFIKGSSNFENFVMPIVTQFDSSAEIYYDLLVKFRKNGNFSDEIVNEDEDDYKVLKDEDEDENDEKLKNVSKINPKVSLIHNVGI